MKIEPTEFTTYEMWDIKNRAEARIWAESTEIIELSFDAIGKLVRGTGLRIG